MGAAKESGADVKVLSIDTFDGTTAYTSDIILAILHGTSQSAQIFNISFGMYAFNRALYEVIAESNALFICAVGNNRRSFDDTPSYPAAYDLPNVMSIASTNQDLGMSFYSNYGTSIDIAATGRGVRSTLPGNRYGELTGTSMSAAYVSGVAASVLSYEDMDASTLRGLKKLSPK